MRLERVRPVTWLQAIFYGLAVVTGGVIVDFAINVITGGTLPGPLAPYGVLAWPLLLTMFGASVAAAIRQYLSSHGTASRTAHSHEAVRQRSIAAQLPDDIHEFTGRRDELRRLRDMVLSDPGQRPAGPVVVTIGGPPGTGKSVLAIRFAHEMQAQYPGAPLYVDLKGASPQELDATAALGELVRGLNADGHQVPADLDGLSREYQRGLRNRRVVIVLDNAMSESQVRPLIPRSPCLVLVTSRRQLDGLEGNQPFRLGEMSRQDAVDLLVRIGGDRLLHSENLDATFEVAELCGRLPLALSIAGVHLRGRRARDVATRLADDRGRLTELQAGERDVRASFDLSYGVLSGSQRALFRRLKLLPESTFDAETASKLLDCGVEDALAELEALVDRQVLERVGDGRYGFNDLIGMFARDKLEKEEPLQARNAACERALRLYLAKATRGAALLEPAIAELAGVHVDPPGPGRLAEQLTVLDWFERERPTLIAAERLAAEIHAHEVAWRLAVTMVPFLDLRGYRSDWSELRRSALAAAAETGRLDDQVWAWLAAGHLCWLDRRSQEARFLLEDALEGAAAGDMPRLQARALYLMGRVEHECEQLDVALEKYNRAAAIFAEEDMLTAQASVVFYVATALREQRVISDGELSRLGDTVLAALAELPPDLWALRTVGWIKEYLARVAAERGDLERAGAHCMASDQAFGRIGFRCGQARVLRDLGQIRLRQGNRGRAREYLERSLVLLQAIGDEAQAGEVRTQLAAIPAQ